MSKGIVYSWIAYFAFLLLTVINHVIFALLDLEPRTWLTVMVWLVIVLTPFVLIFLMLLKWTRILRSSAAKVVLVLVLIVYSIASAGVLFLLGFRGLFHLEDETVLDDGSILVTEAGFPDPGPSYRCLKVMFFARQPIPGTEENADRPSVSSDGSQGTSSSEAPADSDGNSGRSLSDSEASSDTFSSDAEESDASTEPSSSDGSGGEANFSGDSSDSSAQGIDEPTKAAQLIYDKIFAPQGKKCSFQYNAKGNLYVVLDKGTRELDGVTVNTQETLNYDRISKNGKCYLFVYYEEHYDTDGNKLDNTSILNFYAVNLETKEVTAADKTSWSDSGSAAYHEATGEY